jgi:hypothetical protein
MAVDTATLLWGYSAFWIAVITGLFAYLLWTYGKKIGAGVAMRKFGTLILAGICVFAALTAIGVSLPGQTASVGGTGAVYEVTMTEAESQTAVDNDKMEINIHCQFNYNTGEFKLGTGNFTVNFTLDRADAGTKDDIAGLECSDMDIVANHAGGDDVALVLETTEYQIDWTKAVNPDAATITTTTHTGLTYSVKVVSGGTNWVSMNVSLAKTAVDLMVPYVVEHIYFEIGGVQVIANVQVTSYAGTAPT